MVEKKTKKRPKAKKQSTKDVAKTKGLKRKPKSAVKRKTDLKSAKTLKKKNPKTSRAQNFAQEKLLTKEMLAAYQEEKTEKDKRLMMWAGVSFFMAVIVVVWFLNIRHFFQSVAMEQKENDFNWDEISEDFEKTMGEIRKGVDEFKDKKEEASLPAVLPLTKDKASSTPNDINDLRNRIKELEEKLNSDLLE